MAKKVKKEGRPTSYKPEYCEQALKLCKLGSTDDEIADFFGVATRTIYRWRNTHPEFCQALKLGKQEADANVADRLYQRAMGFEHDAEEIKIVKNKIERLKVRKIYPPDTTAAIFWLKNRQKDKWRDKTEFGQTDAEGKDVQALTDAQFEKVLKMLNESKAGSG